MWSNKTELRCSPIMLNAFVSNGFARGRTAKNKKRELRSSCQRFKPRPSRDPKRKQNKAHQHSLAAASRDKVLPVSLSVSSKCSATRRRSACFVSKLAEPPQERIGRVNLMMEKNGQRVLFPIILIA